MTRYEDWPRRLVDYVEACRPKPFEWGAHDCLQFGAGAVRAPAGLPGASAFGSPRLDRRLVAAGLGDADEFGVARLNILLRPAGLVDGDSYGAASLGMRVAPSSHVDPDAFGVAALGLRLGVVGLGSGEVIGGPRLDRSMIATAFANADGIGAPFVMHGGAPQLLQVVSIADAVDALGSAALGLQVLPAGIPSITAAGLPQVSQRLAVTAIADGDTFGLAHVGLRLVLPGMADAGVFGAAALSLYLSPMAIVDGDGIGVPALGLGLAPAGHVDADGIGVARLDLALAVAGLDDRGDGVGQAALRLALLAAGVPAASLFGSGAVLLGRVTPIERTLRALAHHRVAVPVIADRVITSPRRNRVASTEPRK